MPSPARVLQSLQSLLPSGVRRALLRRRLRRRHGISALGPDFGFEIADNVRFGRGCRLGGPVYIAGSSIGDQTYVELGCRISAADVGSHCSIAPYALIGLAEHPTRGFVSTHPRFYRHIPALGWSLVDADRHQEMTRTTVGHDVWVGAGAVIRSGVTIGHGAVIGAGSVVTSDVAPYTIVGGVPAREIRRRFDDDTVEFLLRTRWWDRGEAWLRANADAMGDVDVLRSRLAAEPDA
jgi:acetyltransferase-like isoleucine patch superfamily enzyme